MRLAEWGWMCLIASLAFALQDPGKKPQKKKAQPPAPEQNLPPLASIVVTPGHVDFSQAPAANPIALALSRSGPGTRITIQPGEYPAFSVGFAKPNPNNARTHGGTPDAPVMVEGSGEVRIVPGNAGDTIAFSQGVPNGYITFKNLKIECGYRAGIMFFADNGVSTYAGFRFWDCQVLGGYDHAAQSGAKSKWGVWGSGLKDFEFRGVQGRAVVRDTQHEHGFYLQNPKGDITIENVDGLHLGRTFCQFTARPKEGPAGVGNIVVRNCHVSDCGLNGGDNYKGGSAFTVAGRLTGTILFEKNTFRAGFDPTLRALTHNDAPYGTGAFVAWDRGVGEPNGTLILRDNDFEMADGCGDRSLVSIGGCRDVRIEGKNRFAAGGRAAALDVDPVDESGALNNSQIGKLSVSKDTVLRGDCKQRGVQVLFADLVAGSSPKK